MALSQNTPRPEILGYLTHLPCAAAILIYEGAAVGEDGSGYARPLQGGDVFLGFAEEKADNSDGDNGALRALLRRKGRIELPIAGVTITTNDQPAIYASDDGTFTTVAGGNSLIGYVSRWVSAGVAEVEYDVSLARAALHA